jgi:hypothetical protein
MVRGMLLVWHPNGISSAVIRATAAGAHQPTSNRSCSWPLTISSSRAFRGRARGAELERQHGDELARLEHEPGHPATATALVQELDQVLSERHLVHG